VGGGRLGRMGGIVRRERGGPGFDRRGLNNSFLQLWFFGHLTCGRHFWGLPQHSRKVWFPSVHVHNIEGKHQKFQVYISPETFLLSVSREPLVRLHKWQWCQNMRLILKFCLIISIFHKAMVDYTEKNVFAGFCVAAFVVQNLLTLIEH
jgi:hypothetical protein